MDGVAQQAAILLLAAHSLLYPAVGDSPYRMHITWNPSNELSEYTSYSNVHMFEFRIPDTTVDALWEFQALASDPACPVRNVFVYLQQGGYPIISPYNETYPPDFYLGHSSPRHVVIPTDGSNHPTFIKTPVPGSWYAVAFLRKTEKHFTQKGLASSCGYGVASMLMVRTREVPIVSMTETNHVTFNAFERDKILRYFVPDGVQQYTVNVYNSNVEETNSTISPPVIPLFIHQSSRKLPAENSIGVNCTGVMDCKLKVVSPTTNGWNYIKLSLAYNLHISAKITVNLKFHVHVCKPTLSENYTPEEANPGRSADKFVISFKRHHGHQHANCYTLPDVGRLNMPATDFSSWLVFPDDRLSPQMYNRIAVPDGPLLVMSFAIHKGEDSGGTLKIGLEVDLPDNADQGVMIEACVTIGYIPSLSSQKSSIVCDHLSIHVNSSSKAISTTYIPYPHYGTWYLSLRSQCFSNNNGSVVLVECIGHPWVVIGVGMNTCVDGGCGAHGVCKEQVSGVHKFSSCQCTSGWRGYACTDDTVAFSELLSVLLLTLSNLFFIPAIVVSAHRNLYTEALVYTYTMFFSTFYHACDVTQEYSLCIMKYDVLSFCDFFGSIMSFWVTLLAMSRIHERLRGLMHVLGALCLVLGVEYDRHGLWVFVIPAVCGVVILLSSWGVQCYRRRRLFPSWRRYAYHIIPGTILVASGLVLFTRFETENNYLYTHSAWHIVTASSIVFFLPPKSDNAWRPIKFRRRNTVSDSDSLSLLEHISLD